MKNLLRRLLTQSICLLMFGTGAVYAQNVAFVWKFKTGDVDRYKETSSTVMSSDMMPGGSQVFTNETYSSQRVERINRDGSAEMIRTIDSTSSTMNGKPFENPETKGVVGFPVRMKMATTGRILDVQSVKDSLDQMETAVLQALRSQLMSQPSYPSNPVRINETWQDSNRITQQTQMGVLTVLIRYATTYTGPDMISKVPVSVLKMKISMAGAIEGGAGTVDGTGEGNVYFSGDLGKEVKSVLDITQTMNVNSPQGSVTMKMKTTNTRELSR